MFFEPLMKERRAARRAAKIAGPQQQQQLRRTRLSGFVGIGVVAALSLSLTGCSVVTDFIEGEPADGAIKGVENFGVPAATHVDGTPVDYQGKYNMNPPAGGEHWSAWLNCGVYDQPQQNENAVHDLEHGAIWVTYDPEALSAEDITTLISQLPDTYILVSPYPGLPAPVVASAWANQIKLDGVDDPRLEAFITEFWQSPESPEPGAPCTGAIDGPGKIG